MLKTQPVLPTVQWRATSCIAELLSFQDGLKLTQEVKEGNKVLGPPKGHRELSLHVLCHIY